MKKRITLLLIVVFTNIFAQTDVEKLRNDIVGFSYNYADPASELSVNIAQVLWSNNAQVNDLGKVSFSVVGNYMTIGNENKNFLLKNSNLEILTIVGSDQEVNVPTVLGGVSNTQLEGDIDFLGNGTTQTVIFTVPEGMKSTGLFSYAFQGSIGLDYHSEFYVRYVPKRKADEVINKGYGFALKHNISRWFKNLEAKKIDLALLVSYAKFNVSNDVVFDIQGENINRFVADGNTINYQLLVSKQFNNLSVNLNVAYLTNSYTLSLEGAESALLNILNDGMSANTKTDDSFKFDLGTSYKYKNFDFYTNFSYSNFSNFTLGLQYNL